MLDFSFLKRFDGGLRLKQRLHLTDIISRSRCFYERAWKLKIHTPGHFCMPVPSKAAPGPLESKKKGNQLWYIYIYIYIHTYIYIYGICIYIYIYYGKLVGTRIWYISRSILACLIHLKQPQDSWNRKRKEICYDISVY